jgi:hypothetical protein
MQPELEMSVGGVRPKEGGGIPQSLFAGSELTHK